MNKIYISLIAILLIGGVSALIATENGYILNRSEMAGVGDNVIANYMVNEFGLADYKIIEDKIITYYNITYLESSQGINPETNESETQYRVFTQYKPFIIQKSLWNECTNLTTEAACIDLLVNRETPFTFVENNSVVREVTEYNNVSNEREVEVYDEFGNVTLVTETYYELEPYQVNQTFYEVTNRTITSTYYMARQEQLRQYERAKAVRDNAIDNELDYLFENIWVITNSLFFK